MALVQGRFIQYFNIILYRVWDSAICVKLLLLVPKIKWFVMLSIKWDVHTSAVWESFLMTSSVKSEHFCSLFQKLCRTPYLLQIGGLNLRRRTAMRAAVFALRLRSAIGTRTATISISRLRLLGTRVQRATARSSHCVGHQLCSFALLFDLSFSFVLF